MTTTHRFQTLAWFVSVTLALGALYAPASAQAQRGFEAGVRLGYGVAMGKVDGDSDLSDGIPGQIPIWVDVGYRVLDELMVGLYFQYGFGFVGNDLDEVCDIDDVSCSASDIRLGLQAHYHIRPREQLDPWIGLGVGYEWMSLSSELRGTETSISASGFEFLNLQVGLDIEATDHFKVGPFLSFSLGQYSNASAECSGGGCGGTAAFDRDIDDQALHQWLLIGVRGAYTP